MSAEEKPQPEEEETEDLVPYLGQRARRLFLLKKGEKP